VARPPRRAPCRRRPTAGHEPRRGDGGAGIPWDKNGDFGGKIVDFSSIYLVIFLNKFDLIVETMVGLV